MAYDIKFYRTILNEWFAVESLKRTSDRVYFSSDGKNFLRLNIAGYSSSNSIVTNFSVENPHEGYGWEGKFLFNGEFFIFVREDSPHRPVFRLVDPPQQYEFIPLPRIVELKGLYTMPDGRFLFWTGRRYDFSGSDVKFYFGEIDNLREYEVLSFNGSTIKTSAGNLSIFGQGFEGYKLQVLQHKNFEVEVEGDKIRLVHKKN